MDYLGRENHFIKVFVLLVNVALDSFLNLIFLFLVKISELLAFYVSLIFFVINYLCRSYYCENYIISQHTTKIEKISPKLKF